VSTIISDYDPVLEPIIQRIVETPRERGVEMLAEEFERGLTYRQVMAALFIAGTRYSYGHDVFLLYAAHQVSLDTAGQESLVPFFWGLDCFLRTHELYPREPRPDLKGKLPTGTKALAEFRHAMDSWEREGAERAAIALWRSLGARATIEEFWHYGVREWGVIGHKPIAVANCWRTL